MNFRLLATPATGPPNVAPIDPQLHANTVKLIELSGDRERIQSGLAQRIDDVKARLLQQLPSSDPAYSEELVDRLKSRLKVQDFIDVEVRVYEKHFTSGEIEELLGIEMARREAKPAEVPPQLKHPKCQPSGVRWRQGFSKSVHG